ncbi:MAG: asparagine synthase (glutamine-hydrolyzing), partial [Vicinamibacterales bacterium]|nr:asparagine synthase (glutamine-hydrolyzing) [Vicinamibacterales bacterium]
MCGIAGILNWSSRQADGDLPQLLGQMSDRLAHRGPDDAGQWVEPTTGTGFAHRRLSIIDLSAQGRQPFVDAEGRHVLVLNGEIYNYLELREELRAKGVEFRTATDTEVLLEALKLWGRDALDRLDGMFAFAFHDVAARRTLLARDRFGEKPLYWAQIGHALVFASELVALSGLPGFDGRVDSDAVAEYLYLQYLDSPHAIHRSARKLPPGSWMLVEGGQIRSSGRYFAFRPSEEKRVWNADALADELEDILVRSLRRRLLSDVPTGAFLSGGVDSALVAALICKKLGRPLQTFTLGFAGTPHSEHHQARATATHLGCDHHEKLLAPAALTEFSTVAGALDEPNADTSCLPVYHLAAFARTGITVALSGDGADELFAGYSRYGRMLTAATHDTSYGEPGRAYYSQHLQVWGEAQFMPALHDRPDGFLQQRDALFAEIDSSPLSLCDRLRMADVNHYMPGSVLA